jgi:methionyl-tRNA formyltransferase
VRVVIYSIILPAALALAAGARRSGLEPVAVISPRPIDVSADRRELATALVHGVPAELDVCLAADRGHLARLTRAFEPDLGLCMGYPWRLPPEVLAIPRLGVVNGHPSVLPRHRGPFPFAWAIREGDTDLGLTYHRMDEGFDTGPVLASGSRPMPDDTSMAGMHAAIDELDAELLPVALERAVAGHPGEPQSDDGATNAGPFGEDYVDIDPVASAAAIDRQVRAWQWMFGPAGGRGPCASVDGRRVRLVRVALDDPGDAAVARIEAADAPVWVLEFDAPDPSS